MGTHPIFESDFDCLTEQSSPFASMGARGPPNIDGMVSLKVDNLSYRTSTETLRRKFERYGEIGDCYVPRDRNTGDSRGFGSVRFFDKPFTLTWTRPWLSLPIPKPLGWTKPSQPCQPIRLTRSRTSLTITIAS